MKNPSYIVWNKGLTKETDERVRKNVTNGGKTKKEIWKKLTIEEKEKRVTKLWEIRYRRYGRSGVKDLKKFKNNASLGSKNSWQSVSPIEKEKRILKTILSSQKKPNKTEKRIEKIILDHNLPFVYHGNRPYPGLNGKCPDFVSTNNSRRIIEYDEQFWHQDKDRDITKNEFYMSKGFQVLCLDGEDLKLGEEYILNKIKNWS